MAIAPSTTLVDHLIPSHSSRSINLLKDLSLILGFSVFTAICSQISITTPLTPVPFTLQTLCVLLTGAALGSRRGFLAMLAYLAEGAAGLPVFAGGAGGFIHILGYTGGYLVACPVAALVVGLLCERRHLDRRFLTSALVMLPGTLIFYVLGVPWLALVGIPTPHGIIHPNLVGALPYGMLPFIPGDIVKLVVAVLLLPTAWAIVQKVKPEQQPRG